MTMLFDHLSRLFEEGHARDIPDLLSDGIYASDDRKTPAAVLVAITDRADPGVLLTQRPNTMRDHPGQVAFPGGKIDPGEDAVTAALREAEEELALSREHVRLVGVSDSYHTATGFNVTPVIGVVPPDLDLSPSPIEVAAWFEAPLELLLDPKSWTEEEVFWKGKMRRYSKIDYDGFRIWGVTASILINLSKRIRVEDLMAPLKSA